MANRFWIGGTGNWSDTAHWSTSTGGSGGANAPTSTDDIFIDSSSGFGSGGTITMDAGGGQFNDFTSTSGHTYTITGDTLECFGSLAFEAGTTFESTLIFSSTSPGETITMGGASVLEVDFGGGGAGGVWTLQDDLISPALIEIDDGTLDANNNDVTAQTFYLVGGTAVMGSGTWTATGDDTQALIVSGAVFNVDPAFTITPETSTIKFTSTSAENKTFTGNGKTYNNIWFAGNGSGTFILTDANTFNDFKIDAKNNVKFTQNSTTTVSTFTATGTAGNLITLDSVDGVTQFTLSDTTGTNTCDYLNVSNSNATGGAFWYAGSHSNDTMNNDGWIFTDVPSVVTQVAIGAKKFTHLKLDTL